MSDITFREPPVFARSITIAILFTLLATVSGAQTKLSERAERNRLKPDKPPVVVGVLRDIAHWSVEQLTEHSEIVVEATLTRGDSYINSADTAVYADWAIVPNRVLKGSVPDGGRTPGRPVGIVLTTYGGEVIVNGVSVRAVNHNLRELHTGRYLLFLRRSVDNPTHYQLVNGGVFELQGDTLKRMVYNAGDAYEKFAQTSFPNIAARISAAAR